MRDHSLYVVMTADASGQPIEHRMVIQPEADPIPSGDYIDTGDPTPRLPLRPSQTI